MSLFFDGYDCEKHRRFRLHNGHWHARQPVFTVTMAYSLAKRGLYGRNLVLNLVIFSMLFGGGMIPTYLVVKELHLLDSLWALMRLARSARLT